VSVACSSELSVLNFIVNVHSGEQLDTEIVEWESRLAADKGTGILTPAVEKDSGASEVVHSVVTKKPKVIISVGKRQLFSFLFFVYDFCLLNWIRVDFTPQIQKINKQIVKTIYDLMDTTRIPKEILLPD
jgi:hypothetical protein